MAILQNRLSTTPVVADYIDPSGRDYSLNEDWEAGPIAVTDTSEGLAYQAWKLTYSEEAPYNPPVMVWDGVTGTRYTGTDTFTHSGNAFTILARFKLSAFTGDSLEYLFSFTPPNGTFIQAAFVSDDYTGLPNRQGRLQIWGAEPAGPAVKFLLFTNTGYLDDQYHTLFLSMDSSTGNYTLIIDGQDPEDAVNPDRIAFSTYTMPSGLTDVEVGDDLNGGQAKQMGYFGIRSAYLTNWTDFMANDGTVKELDETGWTEWGAQPAIWNDECDLVINRGTGSNLSTVGTITKLFFPEAGTFTITPETVGDPVIVLSGVTSSQQCTLAFDQNGRPTIAWEDLNQQGYLYWYDTVAAQFVTTAFQQPVTGIALTLDDKRIRQSGANDILLFYTQPNQDGTYTLYHRRQRDRYGVTYELKTPSWPYIHKCGMHEELRVQLTLSTDPPA